MDLMDEARKSKITELVKAVFVKKYAKEDRIPCKIEEGLFLGSLGAALNKDVLKSLNITHVLIVANSLEPAYPNEFIYKKIEVTDQEATDIAKHFMECFSFIDEVKKVGAVLVHCFAGRSRSVTVVVAYLMYKHHMSLSQALEHVKSRRPQAGPNRGFMNQLHKFETSLGGDNVLGDSHRDPDPDPDPDQSKPSTQLESHVKSTKIS